MNITYKTKTTINASIKDAWVAVTQPNFVNDFLPEIKKSINEMSFYVRASHRNAEHVQPSYAVNGQSIGWNKVTGIDIHLPRKDLKANIDAIDITLEERGDNTRVIVEVTYNPTIGKNFILAHRCIRGLFGIKLNVLKKELEADTDRIQLTPSFA